MYNYGDIIEYIDGTNDLNFNNAALWAISNDAQLIELIDRRDLPKRYFQIIKNPEPLPPTEEEQRENRARAYQQEVDPITSHIQRLRDMEQTEEIETEIANLIAERDAKVEEIKQRYPYPVDNSEDISYNESLTL